MVKKLKNISSEVFFVIGIIVMIFASLMNGSQTIMIIKEAIRWLGVIILCFPYIKGEAGSMITQELERQEEKEIVASAKAARIILRFMYLLIGFTIIVAMMTDAFVVMFTLIFI
ncbi:MAG: hypothetical protein U0L23_04770, partial [Lachnospiraceae bacterium]|nr:hypothetical protein [Lachnospiraceae bacterium]